MSELRAFVADLLEHRGAVVERLEPDWLEVLAPAALQRQLGWPEFAHLNFRTQRSEGTIAIGLASTMLGEDLSNDPQAKAVADRFLANLEAHDAGSDK